MPETRDPSTTPDRRRRRPRLRIEDAVVLVAFLGGAPATLTALAFVWLVPATDTAVPTAFGKVLLSLVVLAPWVASSVLLRRRIVYSLRTLSSLLEALRQEDYSMRARRATQHGNRPGDVLDEVHREINLLSETLSSQRLSALEATALLRAVMSEIDLAVFTFDPDSRLRLVNRSGERLMARPRSRLMGRTATELGLSDWLEGDVQGTVERTFPGAVGRWGVRRSTFRQEGVPHRLLVIADLSKTLRHEERQSWQRLIRVIGHELNNSLAPIKSTASTLSRVLRRDSPHEGWRDDAERGLQMIAERCESLNRFVAAYSRLARLPAPTLRPTPVAPLVRRVVSFETRLPVAVAAGPEVSVEADGDQLEQLLINLIKNGVEAALETGGGVEVGWRTVDSTLEVAVVDEGPGLPQTQNLFVPFFTTKPGGTGIGLVLCRQIAEAHGGALELVNRKEGKGCEARLRLPL